MRRELIVKGRDVQRGDLVVRYGVVREVVEIEPLGIHLRFHLAPKAPGLGKMYILPNQDVQVSREAEK